MQAILKGSRIHVSGAGKHSPHFAGIPAARFDKKNLTWTYPASPIAAVRISQAAKQIGEDITLDPSMGPLVTEWHNMKGDLVWKGDKGIKAAENALAVTNPYHTDTVPRPYQVCAGAFIANKRAFYLAMKMGTGKTIVAINRLLENPVEKVLVLCPKQVVDVWPVEFEKHKPSHLYHIVPLTMGSGKKKLEALEFHMDVATTRKQPLMIIVNYEAFIRDPLMSAILKMKWDVVIADEGHRLKSAGGITSRTAAKLKADVRGILSGTPLPNDRRDAYGQFRFLDPAAFGTSVAKFRSRFCEMGGFNNYQVVGWRNEEQFNKILDLYTFRVDEDVLNLPDVINMHRYSPLTAKARKIYDKLEKHFVAEIEGGEVTASNALAKTMKLREICCGFIFDDEHKLVHIHEERKKALKSILEDLPQDEKVVVFCEFRDDLDSIREVAQSLDRNYGEVSGRTNDLVRAAYPDHVSVLGVVPSSGGLGVDCTASHYCIFYSASFNGADHEQAKARLHRSGQSNQVTYIYLVAPDTIEVVVYNALKTKADVTQAIMDYVKHGRSQYVASSTG